MKNDVALKSPQQSSAGTRSPQNPVEEILDRSLYEPIRDLFSRPSKFLRSTLVKTGYFLTQELTQETSQTQASHAQRLAACERLAEVLEAIHAGSLIVDDIQDSSNERRGQPTLHLQYGIPIALNAGNWLYFQPFEWIRRMGLESAEELGVYRLCHEAMLKAHMGQAIDLGARIDQLERERVRAVCMTSLRLKTGSLTSLAISVGGTIGGADLNLLKLIDEFGTDFGIALQMFDDIGNYNLPMGHPKRLEDFFLRRPTWLWAVAADSASDRDFASLIRASKKLPDETDLIGWLNERDIVSQARRTALQHLEDALSRLDMQLNGGLKKRHDAALALNALCERIRNSYG